MPSNKFGRLPSRREARVVQILALALLGAPILAGAISQLASGTLGPSVAQAHVAQRLLPVAAVPASNKMQTAALVASPVLKADIAPVTPVPDLHTKVIAARLEALPAPAITPSVLAPLKIAADGRFQLHQPQVGQGLHLLAEGHSIRLAGIVDFDADQLCRRLDGVQDSCRTRAMARLALLIAGRPVTCQTTGRSGLAASDQAEISATCRAGRIDLAQDVLHYRLVQASNSRVAQRQ